MSEWLDRERAEKEFGMEGAEDVKERLTETLDSLVIHTKEAAMEIMYTAETGVKIVDIDVTITVYDSVTNNLYKTNFFNDFSNVEETIIEEDDEDEL